MSPTNHRPRSKRSRARANTELIVERRWRRFKCDPRYRRAITAGFPLSGYSWEEAHSIAWELRYSYRREETLQRQRDLQQALGQEGPVFSLHPEQVMSLPRETQEELLGRRALARNRFAKRPMRQAWRDGWDYFWGEEEGDTRSRQKRLWRAEADEDMSWWREEAEEQLSA